MDKTNTAILRVAYLIAASDNEVNKEEREVFKKTACALQGLKMGDEDTTELIVGVVEEARKFAILRDFYDEEELIKAFLSKAEKDILAIKGSKVECRKAFAVWISICMADKEYSAFERKLVKAMQGVINSMSTESLVGVSVAAGFGILFGSEAKTKDVGGGPRITDDFLDEVEERCREIDSVQTQLEGAKSDDERSAAASAIDYLARSFKEFIENVEA